MIDDKLVSTNANTIVRPILLPNPYHNSNTSAQIMKSSAVTQADITNFLRKYDPDVLRAIDFITHVKLFTFNSVDLRWENTAQIEGTFFIYERHQRELSSSTTITASPRTVFVFAIINNDNSFIQIVTLDLTHHVNKTFLFYEVARNDKREVYCLHFLNENDCQRAHTVLVRCNQMIRHHQNPQQTHPQQEKQHPIPPQPLAHQFPVPPQQRPPFYAMVGNHNFPSPYPLMPRWQPQPQFNGHILPHSMLQSTGSVQSPARNLYDGANWPIPPPSSLAVQPKPEQHQYHINNSALTASTPFPYPLANRAYPIGNPHYNQQHLQQSSPTSTLLSNHKQHIVEQEKNARHPSTSLTKPLTAADSVQTINVRSSPTSLPSSPLSNGIHHSNGNSDSVEDASLQLKRLLNIRGQVGFNENNPINETEITVAPSSTMKAIDHNFLTVSTQNRIDLLSKTDYFPDEKEQKQQQKQLSTVSLLPPSAFESTPTTLSIPPPVTSVGPGTIGAERSVRSGNLVPFSDQQQYRAQSVIPHSSTTSTNESVFFQRQRPIAHTVKCSQCGNHSLSYSESSTQSSALKKEDFRHIFINLIQNDEHFLNIIYQACQAYSLASTSS
ncbi:unnamed protein product [Didymodactylos carnosus]|uniref:Uncharacterized protein n=1 Tax=Didymodactylos carnosus TaxID=1234261 RepID=A0A8S2GMA9_9BILA|nr:unnamed protein product [Didymodactylos carnosus]CAF3537876.1 unnamed protein product [Didymodactylos carnosus]